MIFAWFANLHPIWQALLGTCFTWFLTALGAAAVFVFRTVNRKVLDGMLGFAAGVMIAASFWSLLAPAIEMAEGSRLPAWVPATVGFLLGGAFLWAVDKVLPHLHLDFPTEEAEGIQTSWQRSVLLVLAITLHNFPEGLAVGVAFGALGAGLPSASLAGAVALALGIGSAVVIGSSFMGNVPGNITAVTSKTTNLLVTPIFGLFFFALFVPFARPAGVLVGAACGTATAVLIAFSGPIFGMDPETGLDPVSFMWIGPVALLVNIGTGTAACLVLRRLADRRRSA